MRIRVLLVGMLASACSAEPRGERIDASPPQPVPLSVALPDSVSADWRVFSGNGFQLRHPPNATVAPGRSHPNNWQGTAIRGPVVHLEAPPDYGPSDGPAYELVVAVARKAISQSLETWVDSLIASRNALLDPDWRLGAPDSVRVGASYGLQLRPACGDCDPYEVYVARGEVVVVLSYYFDPSFPGDRARQHAVYRLILSTLDWDP